MNSFVPVFNTGLRAGYKVRCGVQSAMHPVRSVKAVRAKVDDSLRLDY